MYIKDKLIAMTDLETSGDVFGVHEILEIGLVVFDQNTFEIKETMNVKVKPEKINNAVPEALLVNGYNEIDWEGAVSLDEAMQEYAEKTKDCVFCAYNVSFDWGFISNAFYKCKIPNHMSTRENHDRLDLLSIAYERGMKDEQSLSLKNACIKFGIPTEPEEHRALNGAMTAYNLFKKFYE